MAEKENLGTYGMLEKPYSGVYQVESCGLVYLIFWSV